MKPLINFMIAVFSISILNNCLNSNNKADTYDGITDLHGRVQSYTETSFYLIEKFGEIEKGDVTGKLIEKFDRDGKITERIRYNADGTLSGHIFYEYDDKSNPIRVKGYDDDGRITFINTIQNIYNINGKLIKQDTFDTEGRLQRRWLFEYDKDGNETKSYQYYNYEGEEAEYIETLNFIYDDNGKLIERLSLRDDSTLREKIVYDQRGILSKKSYDINEKIERKVMYKYDESGNVTERLRFSSDESLLSRTLRKYDKEGNLLKIESYDSQGNLDSETQYLEYDNLSNWSKRYNFYYTSEYYKESNLTPPPSRIFIREINYYN